MSALLEKAYFDAVYSKAIVVNQVPTTLNSHRVEISNFSTIPIFLNRLSNVRGDFGLEICCGSGWLLTTLPSIGKRGVGLDISIDGLKLAKQRPIQRREPHLLSGGSAFELPFQKGSFDFVIGFAALHHLVENIETASSEIRRVLKAGGKAIFCEPLGENPLLQFVRRHIPYPQKQKPTVGEHSLRYNDIEVLSKGFFALDITHLFLLQMMDRILPSPSLSQALGALDHQILSKYPSLNRYCRYIIIECSKG